MNITRTALVLLASLICVGCSDATSDQAQQEETTEEHKNALRQQASLLKETAQAQVQETAQAQVQETITKAKAGEAQAQYELGAMYINGQGVHRDDKEAVKWFRKAAEQGLAQAQSDLGVMYERGKGVPQDDKEAVKWFRKAAEQGNATAQCSLGYCYKEGRGVPQDYVAAYAWLGLSGLQSASFVGIWFLARELAPQQFAEAKDLHDALAEKIEANKKKAGKN